jgi:hypothetical protein
MNNADLQTRITELERMCRDYLQHTDTLEAKLAAVDALPEKWIEKDTTLVAAHTRAMSNCANELEEALE